MSKLLTTDAIVLKSIPYKDRDKIFTLFSPELGKVSAIAKGIKKYDSKRLSLMDAQNYVRVGLAGDRDLKVLTEVSLKHSFSSIKSDYLKLKTSFYLLEVINRYFEATDDSKGVFDLLIKVLSRLEELENFDSRVENYFEMEFLRQVGYEFNFYSCTSCGLGIESPGSFSLNASLGGLVCSNCVPQNPVLNWKEIEGIKLLLKKPSLQEVDFTSLDNFLKNQVQELISGGIKTLKFLT